ncbi:MAG: paraquat-inducible protein A [Gammaproteobacteria bacterium]|nr:paraquat-inducible protein A [Gammaproteobacteria bacterium]NNJ84432.1 paraquat-inducible protein A [Gammaproteobacteria bacterium]
MDCRIPEHELIACPGCDLLHHTVVLPLGARAECRRCGYRLYTQKPQGIERPLALTLAAFVFFVLANTFPFIAIEIQGITREISVLSAAIELYHQGMPGLGILASAVIFVFPLLQLAGMLTVLVPLYTDRANITGCKTLRFVSILAPWSMMEIYLLGVLVSLVKLATYAHVTLGVAFWSFAALVITNTWITYSIDRHDLWRRLESLS